MPILVFGGELNFSATSASAAENSAKLLIEISRTGVATSPASVLVSSINGSAKSTIDFKAVSETVSWAAGNSDSKTLEVEIIDNSVVEAERYFSLVLSGATGDTIGSTSSISITITDFEEGQFQFQSETFVSNEKSGKAIVVINRVKGSTEPATVQVKTTDDTAIGGVDFTAVDEIINFAAGQESFAYSVNLQEDTYGEPTKSFKVTLSSPTSGAALGSPAEAVISINDDDLDFTTNAPKIKVAIPQVSHGDIIDLSKTSPIDPTNTHLGLINAIPIIAEPRLQATQDSSGLLEIKIGNDFAFYAWPSEITKNTRGVDPTVIIQRSGQVDFYTKDGLLIKAFTAVASLSDLATELALLALPDFEISSEGNVLIQANQGPPTYEKIPGGKIVLANSFYTKWNLRPQPVITNGSTEKPGLELVPHPSLSDESLVAHHFKIGDSMKTQYFNPTALSETELESEIKKRTSVLSVVFLSDGVIQVQAIASYDPYTKTVSKSVAEFYADYSVTRTVAFDRSLVGFQDHYDVNGDGLQDYLMIYSNGYEQVFFLKSYALL